MGVALKFPAASAPVHEGWSGKASHTTFCIEGVGRASWETSHLNLWVKYKTVLTHGLGSLSFQTNFRTKIEEIRIIVLPLSQVGK